MAEAQATDRTPHVLVPIPVLLVGGTEMQTLNLVRVLLGGGYRVTVCCYYRHDPTVVESFEQSGARVMLLERSPEEGLLRLLRLLVSLFRREAPDVVHVQYMAPGFIPVLAARLAGVRTLFATVHQPGRTYGAKAHLLLRLSARLCTAFFCNSQSVERSWFGDSAVFAAAPAQAPARRHWTVYNAVDFDAIASDPASSRLPSLRQTLGLGGRPVVGCVARLRSEKGQTVLLEAMPLLLKTLPDAVLLLVGDGPDRAALQRRAGELGIEANLRWMGLQPFTEVARLYRVMDVVAVPSVFEGFGLTAAEAMAAGCVVVASDVDGLAEVVLHRETGLLFPPQDPRQLALALQEALSDRAGSAALAHRGHLRCRELFSFQRYREVTLRSYEVYGAK